MKPFIYCANLARVGAVDGLSICIAAGIRDKDELLSQLSSKLRFPDYFGNNWDALDECLRDLSWLPQRSIVVIHERLPELPDEEIKEYLSILSRAVMDWNGDERHELIVVFPIIDEAKISNALI